MPGKIVFINQATGYLTIDIVNEFVKEFDKVALITGSIRVQNTELHSGVNVSKIIRYNRGSNVKKALSWFLGTIQIFFLLKLKYRAYDIFFITIPPTAYLLALNFKSLFSIAVYDIYPEALKINGFSEKGVIFKWWAGRNRKIFPKAHRIFTLSESMKSCLHAYAELSDIRVIHNWSAFSGNTPVKKEQNKIIERENLHGKFVVQYSGNIGATHNVEVLVEVAELLRLHKDIEFQIIGRGDRSLLINEMIKSKSLTNCRLLPFRKDDELYESLCSANIAVITLDDRIPDVSVPSKTYNILSAGIPIMAISLPGSAVSEMIQNLNVGKAFDKYDISGMCEFILELKNNSNLWKKMAGSAHRASLNFSKANAAKYLEHYKYS